MDIIYLLIPLAIIIVGVGVWAFFWAVDSGQFEDLESPAHSILYDDDADLIPEDARPKDVPKPTDAPRSNTPGTADSTQAKEEQTPRHADH